MATFQEKLAKLEEVRLRMEAMVASGVDIKSPEAVPLGLEFVHAFADCAKDLGYEILKPISAEFQTKVK
jgi:hypothetical protein